MIPGWDQGVEGMKVGGRRELVIPSDLAYGPQGSAARHPPDDTLVFVVDLRDVQPGRRTGGGGARGAGGRAASARLGRRTASRSAILVGRVADRADQAEQGDRR